MDDTVLHVFKNNAVTVQHGHPTMLATLRSDASGFTTTVGLVCPLC